MISSELVYNVSGDKAKPVKPITLAAAGLRERAHLQEWVISNPEILGEGVMVITSEFDRWVSQAGKDPDRLDVLGLETSGRLVVAELKRDIAPESVSLQAINYAARASRFTPELLAEAYLEFRGKASEDAPGDPTEALTALLTHAPDLSIETIENPRIVLVAGEFPPRVTSSVVWLSERGVDISLVRVQAYEWGDSHAITVSRVWPVPNLEEFVVAPTRAERATQRPAPLPSAPWTEEDLRRLITLKVSATILTTMDLCAQKPNEWIGGDEVQLITGRGPNEHRGDYGGFGITLIRKFQRSNQPYEMNYGVGGNYIQYYRLTPELAEIWRNLRGLDTSVNSAPEVPA